MYPTHSCPWWKVCRGSRDVVTSCAQDLWDPTNHHRGITVAGPHGQELNKLNTSKHWMAMLMVKILQPETQVLHPRNFFKTGRVISLLVLCLNILRFDMLNCETGWKTRASSDPCWHHTQHRAALWRDASSKAAQAELQLTYLALPQDLLTQVVPHFFYLVLPWSSSGLQGPLGGQHFRNFWGWCPGRSCLCLVGMECYLARMTKRISRNFLIHTKMMQLCVSFPLWALKQLVTKKFGWFWVIKSRHLSPLWTL